jgi:phage FluMu protein Com
MLDSCKLPRHQPITYEITGVEVSCPLCMALDEIEHDKMLEELAINVDGMREAMLDSCKLPRHQPIMYEITGVEVSCPLCRALDEIEHDKMLEELATNVDGMREAMEALQKDFKEYGPTLERLVKEL